MSRNPSLTNATLSQICAELTRRFPDGLTLSLKRPTRTGRTTSTFHHHSGSLPAVLGLLELARLELTAIAVASFHTPPCPSDPHDS